MVDSAECSKVGPDYFCYYAQEISQLLLQCEDSLPSTRSSKMSESKPWEIRDNETGRYYGGDCFFSNSIGAELSDFRLERLKALLRQSVSALTSEVDEMLDPVMAMCRLQYQLRCKNRLSSNASVVPDDDAENPCKKLKTSSSPSLMRKHEPTHPINSTEVDADMQFLLENDSKQVEETVKKYSDELLSTLGHMEQQLEKILDTVISTCRPMSRPEKRNLQKLINKLPSRNLDRVVEIIQRHTPTKEGSQNEIFVDLEQEDNVTLWRLYFYAEAVKKARELVP